MKYLIIIGDGMAENPLRQLDGKTPLEAAEIPYIHSLAARGQVGSVLNVPPGYPPGSDTAIMSILGCPPVKYYSGRAPLEAAAQGILLSPGDAALRCNNVTVSDEPDKAFADRLIISHSAGGIEPKYADELISWLFAHPDFKPFAENAGITIYPSGSYRHIAVAKNVCLDGLITIPPHDHLDEKVSEHLPSGCGFAGELTSLMERAAAILDTHPVNIRRKEQGQLPANGIWFWAHGTVAGLPDFYDRYQKRGALISAVPLCQGIARLSGLDVVLVEGATGELETNYEGKVQAAIEALRDHDFVTVHLEGADECTHNGNLPGKLEAIKRLDSRVVRPLVESLTQSGVELRLLLLSDHKTLTVERIHNGDPVPYLFYDSRRDTGSGALYTEAYGEAGEFIPDGAELIPRLFEQA